MHRRGQTLIEVLVAMVVLTILFVFVTGDLMAVSHGDKATDQTVEIAAANYYLGIMNGDPEFWDHVGTGSGPTDPCGQSLPSYTDSFPSPPAVPNWNQFQYCAAAPAFISPQDESSPQPITIEYMWSAAIRPSDSNAADLTIWIRRDGSAPVAEYHALRYRSPSLESPTPYPTPTPSASPSSSPTIAPSPRPTPSRPPTPTPSPTPIGI
jgi:prepilin-type N-terminal cleavage/methylation domain-containing protein